MVVAQYSEDVSTSGLVGLGESFQVGNKPVKEQL